MLGRLFVLWAFQQPAAAAAATACGSATGRVLFSKLTWGIEFSEEQGKKGQEGFREPQY